MHPILLFAYGTIVGSFLNVVILRSLNRTSINGRSACPHCGRTLRWHELIPILSFIVRRGRCHSCRHQISPQYTIIEFTYGILFLTLYPDIPAMIIAALLLILITIDLKTFLLPDFFTLVLGLVVFISGDVSLTGMLAGAGFLLLLWLITKGRGIGFGDVKLMVPVGLYFGLTTTVGILFIAFFAGAAVGVLLLALKKADRKTAIPFGPFLAGASLVALVFPHVYPTLMQALYGI